MLDELILEIGSENKDGIIFGDCFYLNYYGINVFLYVCKTTSYQACVFELAKKRMRYNGKMVEVLSRNLKPTKAPLLVLENNCFSKSEYWLDTTSDNSSDKCLLVPVHAYDPLYKKALDAGVEIPETGIFKAICLEKEREIGLGRFYWEVESRKLKNKKINKIQNRA